MGNIELPIHLGKSASEDQREPEPVHDLDLASENEAAAKTEPLSISPKQDCVELDCAGEQSLSLSSSTALDEQVLIHLGRFKEHHELAHLADKEAFGHTIIAAVAIVLIKAGSKRGKFASAVEAAFDGISARTLRRYRKAGESYLSSAHGMAISAQLIRKQGITLNQELCDVSGIIQYLQANGIYSHAQLLQHTKSKFPPSARSSHNSPGPATRALQILERALSKMDQPSRNEFWKGMNEVVKKFPQHAGTENDTD